MVHVSLVSSLRPLIPNQICSRMLTYPEEKVNINVGQDYNKKLEVFRFLGRDKGWGEGNMLSLLKPVEKCWQPQDLLPDASAEDFVDQIHHLQEMNKELPDEYFVVLTGDMITEEALPTYVSLHKSMDAWGDEEMGWQSLWIRGWSAEENRHGDLLNRYLYLSGRVDMKQVEKTIQYLINSGMDIGVMKDPYYGAVYATFQERATFLSHSNTANLAKRHGDTKLAQICGLIAADERRHETAYCRLFAKVFELDPDGALLSFADMLRRKLSMPAHLMYDGRDENLFSHFSNVASRIGVYGTADYIDVTEHLVAAWNVEKLEGLSSDATKAQEFICRFPKVLRRLGEKADFEAKKDLQPPVSFSWIFNRKI